MFPYQESLHSIKCNLKDFKDKLIVCLQKYNSLEVEVELNKRKYIKLTHQKVVEEEVLINL
jgi:hypothetical protein